MRVTGKDRSSKGMAPARGDVEPEDSWNESSLTVK